MQQREEKQILALPELFDVESKQKASFFQRLLRFFFFEESSSNFSNIRYNKKSQYWPQEAKKHVDTAENEMA